MSGKNINIRALSNLLVLNQNANWNKKIDAAVKLCGKELSSKKIPKCCFFFDQRLFLQTRKYLTTHTKERSAMEEQLFCCSAYKWQ